MSRKERLGVNCVIKIREGRLIGVEGDEGKQMRLLRSLLAVD